MAGRRPRDLDLLDKVDALPRTPYEGTAWRIAREGRDPLQGYPAAARWDPGTFDVIYTSLAREGSLAEIHFHLSRQPVFPSKLVSVLHRITLRTRRALQLVDLSAAESFGVDRGDHGLTRRREEQVLAAGLNANLGGRDQIPLEVERQVTRWMAAIFGYPESASGLFVTGTSMDVSNTSPPPSGAGLWVLRRT